MKRITEIKNEVRSILRKNGYKKVDYQVLYENVKDGFSFVDGCVVFCIGSIYYSFGTDKLMGCSAHICDFHNDCGTSADMLLPTFKKHISGEISEKDVIARWFYD